MLACGSTPPPYQQAMHDLKELRESKILDKGEIKEYYTRLTDILHAYFIRQYQIGSYDQTTREYLICVHQSDLRVSVKDKIKTILYEADFVKFAKVVPPPSESTRLIRLTEEVIESAKPKDKKVVPKTKAIKKRKKSKKKIHEVAK